MDIELRKCICQKIVEKDLYNIRHAIAALTIVWGVSPIGKTDVEIAEEGLSCMESYMRELGLAMHITELGVTEDMLDGIAKGSFILPCGYKVLTHDEIVSILKESMD